MIKNNGPNIEEKNIDIDTAFGKLLRTPKDKDDLYTDLKGMIKHQISLTDTVETRRIQMNQFALQTLAFSVAAIGLLVTIADHEYTPLLRGMIAFLGTYAVTALVTSVVYMQQSSFRYPFLSLPRYTNKWKWFYYGNPHVTKISLSLKSLVFKSSKFIRVESDKFINSLLFIIDSITNETEEKAILDAVQQFHLLQAHNCYKNGFYLQLAKIRKVGTYISLATFLFFSILY